MYKPYHLIGLELGISVLSAALRGEPTGQATGWRGDVVAVAKRGLRAGEMLDGEGGYTVWGKLVPSERSLAEGALPIGLAHKVILKRDIAAGCGRALGRCRYARYRGGAGAPRDGAAFCAAARHRRAIDGEEEAWNTAPSARPISRSRRSALAGRLAAPTGGSDRGQFDRAVHRSPTPIWPRSTPSSPGINASSYRRVGWRIDLARRARHITHNRRHRCRFNASRR